MIERHSELISSPLVSVLLPTYNASQYLKYAIVSILEQTYPNIELIIVDDGSTDNSYEVACSFKSKKILVLKQDENLGYPTAMNLALTACQGEYIARMDADDMCEPDRIEKQMAFLMDHPDCTFVGTDVKLITPNGKVIKAQKKENHPPAWRYEDWNSVYSKKRLFADPSVICRKEKIIKAGGYRTYSRSGQDVDLWLRMLEDKGTSAATLEDPLYVKRLVVGAISHNKKTSNINRLPRLLADQRIKNGYDAIMRNEPLPDVAASNLLEEKTLSWLWRCVELCVLAGDYPGAREFLGEAFHETDGVFNLMKYSTKTLLSLIGSQLKNEL